jgi:hypothetical protein
MYFQEMRLGHDVRVLNCGQALISKASGTSGAPVEHGAGLETLMLKPRYPLISIDKAQRTASDC